MYEGRRRYDEGDALRKRSLAIIERAYGAESFPFAQSLKALAGVYGQQGRNKEALDLLLRASQIAEKTLSLENPDLYAYFSDIGSRYLALKRCGEAEPFLTRALTGLEKAQGYDPFVAGGQIIEILKNLAYCHIVQGHYPEARAFIDRAIAVGERMLGADHSQFGNALNTLGAFLLLQEQTDEAERLLERALPITERAGKTQPFTRIPSLGWGSCISRGRTGPGHTQPCREPRPSTWQWIKGPQPEPPRGQIVGVPDSRLRTPFFTSLRRSLPFGWRRRMGLRRKPCGKMPSRWHSGRRVPRRRPRSARWRQGFQQALARLQPLFASVRTSVSSGKHWTLASQAHWQLRPRSATRQMIKLFANGWAKSQLVLTR